MTGLRKMEATSAPLSKPGSQGSSERYGSESGAEEKGQRPAFEYFGWIYHLGINSLGREYCHLRFLFIRGKYVEMYKRDPHEFPGIVRTSTFYSCQRLFEFDFSFFCLLDGNVGVCEQIELVNVCVLEV